MRICLSSYVVHSYVELGYREMYRMTSCWVVARGARGQKEAAPKQDDVFALLLIYFSHFEERPGEISRQRPSADGGRPGAGILLRRLHAIDGSPTMSSALQRT